MKDDSYKPPTDEEWDRRMLCIDGSCIGVIGPDGRCTECGKSAGKDFQPPAAADAAETSADAENAPPEPAVEKAQAETAGDDSNWANRRLCSDGNCIGVIGPDGNCKACGRPYTGEA